MDLVRFAGPLWLLAAPAAWAAILVFALAARPRRPRARARAILACLAAGLLAVALAGPRLKVSRAGPCPVWLVEDVSPSMRPGGRAPAGADALAPYAAAVPSGPAFRLRFPRAEDPSGPAAASPGAARTDVAQALQEAAAAGGGDCGILLLYSDARETRGDAVRAAEALAARGLRVYAVAPNLAPRDVRVAGLSAPPQAPIGAPVPIRVRLASTVPARATVRLERRPAEAGAEARAAEVAVDPAAGAEALFQDAPPAPALYTYYVQISSSEDDWPENDRASCLVRVGDGFDVAYVYGGERPGDTLRRLRAAAPAGVRFRSVAAGQFASPLAGETAVVLDNVSAWALGPAAADLARRVTEGGLGLLALGGDSAFGAGGYDESPLEDLLPVSSRTAVRPPLDLVFAIDSSGSMNEMAGGLAKIAAAKFAVLDLRSALAAADRVGVVAFAGEPRVAAPLAPASDWDRLRRSLVEIEAGGGTRITPAVTAAIGLFGPPGADPGRVRHVMLLSDGRSADFDVASLAAACRAAAASLSAVATGPDADRDRLGRLAQETGGRLYVSGGVARQSLRETFLRDMAWKRGEGLRAETRAAEWRAAGPIWPETGPPLPAVDALNLTQPKPAADVLWAAASAAPAAGRPPPSPPLLAAWRKGLGKVAAMPWPVSAASGKWVEGDALGGYVAAILAWLYQPNVPRDWSARLAQRGPQWWVRVEETCASLGKSLPPPAATAWGEGDAGPRAVTLAQVAPGVYEGKVGDEGGGATRVVVRRPPAAADSATPGGEETVQLAVPGLPPAEYERLGVDRDRLEQIVRAGGGSILESPDALADAVRRSRSQGYVPAGLYFVLAAGAVMLAQAALRMAGKL